MGNQAAISIEKHLQLQPADLVDRLQRLPVEEPRDILVHLPSSIPAVVTKTT